MDVVASGLRFPEGPVLDSDGTILVTEVAGGAIARVDPATGTVERVADCGGGPNGAALGPDGRLYVCNNGGLNFAERDGAIGPDGARAGNDGGSIQAVDVRTGAVDTLYETCGPNRLLGPNDIVFDAAGGFYFTDYGRGYARHRNFGAVYYALPDGSSIVEAVYPLPEPNGIGLSPDGATLYVALTPSKAIWSWPITAPGVVGRTAGFLRPGGGTLVAGLPGHQPLDSFAVDADGNICVGTLGMQRGGVTVVSPHGEILRQVHAPLDDPFVTNVCFGGDDLATAYVTSSGRGLLYATHLVTKGLPLHHGPGQPDRSPERTGTVGPSAQ